MKRFVLSLLIAGAFASCSKHKEVEGDASLVGTWNLEQVRYDPGDGSGTWQPVETTTIVEFKANGGFSDQRRPEFDRYSRDNDVITVTSSTDATALYHFYIQDLNGLALTWHLDGLWCGGPPGEKLLKIKK